MGKVYFIQSAAGPIKIGYTEGIVRDRLANLQTGCADKLKLLAVADGTMKDESMLHARFHLNRLHGEWFKPEKDLMDYIFPCPDPQVQCFNPNTIELPVDLDDIMGEFELQLLKRALDISKGSKMKAAEMLGITFRSFRYRLDKYNLD